MARASGQREVAHGRHGLTDEEIRRLWIAAVKDDEALVDEIIRRTYHAMRAFDGERADLVIDLAIRRHRDAHESFRSLLADAAASGEQSREDDGHQERRGGDRLETTVN